MAEEKKVEVSQQSIPTLDLERAGERQGYVLEADLYEERRSNLKTAKDGHTVLIPQPSDSPNDPLNWAPAKKHVVLAVISIVGFMGDFGSSIAVPAVIPQTTEWSLPAATVQHNLVGNLFAIGGGGLCVVFLSAYFGRLPILVLFTAASLGTAAWCAAATSFNSYLGARILNGFFASVSIGGGLMWIKDIFFFHEHPRKINIWSGALTVAPYMGPFVSSFIIWHGSWRWAYWTYTIICGISLILVLLFTDESFYNRNVPKDLQRPLKSRSLRLLGVEQWQSRGTRSSLVQAVSRPLIAISKLPVLLITVNYFLIYAWYIAVNATTAIWLSSIYNFTAKGLGVFYLAGFVGTAIGWVLGHWLYDAVGRAYAKHHSGRIQPESRLIVTYIGTVLQVVALLVIGFTLQNHWHYMILAVFYALQVVAMLISTVGVNSYLLDAYPEGSGEVSAWINFGRNAGGFMATYIQLPWLQEAGTARVFGIQAAIVVSAAFIIIFLQLFGQNLRAWQGRMRFATN